MVTKSPNSCNYSVALRTNEIDLYVQIRHWKNCRSSSFFLLYTPRFTSRQTTTFVIVDSVAHPIFLCTCAHRYRTLDRWMAHLDGVEYILNRQILIIAHSKAENSSTWHTHLILYLYVFVYFFSVHHQHHLYSEFRIQPTK